MPIISRHEHGGKGQELETFIQNRDSFEQQFLVSACDALTRRAQATSEYLSSSSRLPFRCPACSLVNQKVAGAVYQIGPTCQ